MVENLKICYLGTGSPTKFADLQFADQSKGYQQNLRICNLRINQKKFVDSHISEICGFPIAD
jgi:hypothetical protein